MYGKSGPCDIKFEVRQQLSSLGVEETLSGSTEVEAFTGPVVESISDSVTVTLGEVSEAGSLRGILSDEAIGVLIGASLPGVVGCGEVEVSAGGGFDRLIAMELGAVINGDGTDSAGGSTDEFNRPAVGGLDGAGAEFADDREAGLAVDEGEEAVPVCTEHGVTLKVADTSAVLCAWRSFGDGPLTGQAPPGVIAAVAFTAPLAGTAKMAMERTSTPLVAPDVTIDGFVTDGEQPEPAKPSADLLRAEVLSEPTLDELPVRR